MITLRPSPYEYRRRLPHYQKSDRPIFVTFRKLTTDPLPSVARDLILEHCLHDNGSRFALHAAVVMPEHVHMLFTPLRDQDGWPVPVAKILQLIKGVSARKDQSTVSGRRPALAGRVLRSRASLG